MGVNLDTEYGTIEIPDDTIASVVGNAATQNYGVVGMASKNQIRDTYNEILKIENFKKGVVVSKDDYGIVVDVYIFVNYGTKISEICRNVQSTVKYDLDKILGITASTINIFVQGVYNLED